jgi:hypothetical protein
MCLIKKSMRPFSVLVLKLNFTTKWSRSSRRLVSHSFLVAWIPDVHCGTYRQLVEQWPISGSRDSDRSHYRAIEGMRRSPHPCNELEMQETISRELLLFVIIASDLLSSCRGCRSGFSSRPRVYLGLIKYMLTVYIGAYCIYSLLCIVSSIPSSL